MGARVAFHLAAREIVHVGHGLGSAQALDAGDELLEEEDVTAHELGGTVDGILVGTLQVRAVLLVGSQQVVVILLEVFNLAVLCLLKQLLSQGDILLQEGVVVLHAGGEEGLCGSGEGSGLGIHAGLVVGVPLLHVLCLGDFSLQGLEGSSGNLTCTLALDGLVGLDGLLCCADGGREVGITDLDHSGGEGLGCLLQGGSGAVDGSLGELVVGRLVDSLCLREHQLVGLDGAGRILPVQVASLDTGQTALGSTDGGSQCGVVHVVMVVHLGAGCLDVLEQLRGDGIQFGLLLGLVGC